MKNKLFKTIFCSVFFLMIGQVLTAQKYTLSGYLDDSVNGEKLIGATIYVPQLEQGTITNTYGFYSLSVPSGKYNIQFSYIGYEAQTLEIDLSKDIELDVHMNPSLTLQEVEVVATQSEEKIEEKSQMSTIDVGISQIKSLPALLGEVDILKTIQLLPGVQSGTEGSSGIYVRGGGPDQNLILLDGVPIYNVSHLFGFFSVFNADAIRKVELVKGGFPARYGGRLSSVLNINMKEGNSKELHGEGSIGLISSKLTIEGPIIKDKTSFIISGRRTYADLLFKPLIKRASKIDDSNTNPDGSSYSYKENTNAGYFFYDLNAKVNHKFSDKDRLYLSYYGGRDKGGAETDYDNEQSYGDGLGFEDSGSTNFGLAWGNQIMSLRWNHQFSKKLFANTTAIYSYYDFTASNDYEDNYKDTYYDFESMEIKTNENKFSGEFDYSSKIRDIGLKFDLDYVPNPNHYIKFGASAVKHKFTPGVFAYKEEDSQFTSIDTTLTTEPVNAGEYYVYGEDDFNIGSRIKVNAGLHASAFFVKDTSYFSLQPRLSMRYMVNPHWSVKGSYAMMTQYLHLLSNSGLSLPTDLWVPPTDIIGPQRSWQVALGLAHTFKEQYEVSVEAYYKEMKDLISYKEGASFILIGESWENKVTVGDGDSKGIELFVQKKKGKTSGWLGYTLSWTNRVFPGGPHPTNPEIFFDPINFGETYAYKYDRRHDFSIAVNHRFNEKLELGVVWVYGTGNSVTLPASEYVGVDEYGLDNDYYYYEYGDQVIDYGNKNAYRMRAYHRLDIGLNIYTKPKWGEGRWSIGTYNTYSRKNPFFIYKDSARDNDTGEFKTVFKQVSLFPIIPSVAYYFKF